MRKHNSIPGKARAVTLTNITAQKIRWRKNACTEYTAFTLGEQWSSSPTIVKLCVILQRYSVIYDTVWNCSSSVWNWTSQVLTWTLSWVNLTKPTCSFSSRNEEFKRSTACQHTCSGGKVVQTAGIRSRTTVSREQVFGRGLPCSQRCRQKTGSRSLPDQVCKTKEIEMVESNFQNWHENLGAMQPEYFLYLFAIWHSYNLVFQM